MRKYKNITVIPAADISTCLIWQSFNWGSHPDSPPKGDYLLIIICMTFRISISIQTHNNLWSYGDA